MQAEALIVTVLSLHKQYFILVSNFTLRTSKDRNVSVSLVILIGCLFFEFSLKVAGKDALFSKTQMFISLI